MATPACRGDAMAYVLLAVSLGLFPLLGKEFVPHLEEWTIRFSVADIQLMLLEESIRVSKLVDAEPRRKLPKLRAMRIRFGPVEGAETADID